MHILHIESFYIICSQISDITLGDQGSLCLLNGETDSVVAKCQSSS